MSQITLDTDKVWDIGKASEATQKRIIELSEGLQSQVKGLSHIEDFIQVYDERIQRQIRRMKNEANRCGMAASYIFKIAEHYERTDSGLKKGLSILAPVLDKTRAENDAAFKKVSLPDNFSIIRNGEKTVYQYDVKTQRQNDSNYKGIEFYKVDSRGNKIPDSGTIGSSGCGPSSFSSCINALNGNELENPKTMSKYAQKCGARTEDGTVMETLFSRWCKDHPEYKYKTLFGVGEKQHLSKQEALNELINALKEGKVGTLGTSGTSDSKTNNNIFAGREHIVAVIGVEETSGGEVRLIISDPDAVNNSTYYNRCVKTGMVEMIGDKTYVNVNAASKFIRSIRIISKS